MPEVMSMQIENIKFPTQNCVLPPFYAYTSSSACRLGKSVTLLQNIMIKTNFATVPEVIFNQDSNCTKPEVE